MLQNAPDAMRFWEQRRLPYNAVLTVVVAVWFIATWPHFRSAVTWWSLLRLMGLAFIANALYSAGYLADVLVAGTAPAAKQNRWRAIVWWVGTAFAVLLANYWIVDEIYPYVP